MEEIWNSEHSLKELVSDDKFKSFDELKEKLDRVLGLGNEFISKPEEVPFDGGKPYTPPPTPVTAETDDKGEEEEAMGYFQKLAEEA